MTMRGQRPMTGGIVIAGCGSYLPGRPVTNDEIEAQVGTGYDRCGKGQSLHDWARRHHGGSIRYWADDNEATSDLALAASRRALADADMTAADLDLIVVSTFTSDHPVPSTAARLQAGLAARAKFLQIDAACSGFVDGMWIATSLMRQQGLKTVLVVAADVLSRLSGPQQYLPKTVFGDAAGAVVLTWHDDAAMGVREFSTGSDGQLGDYVLIPSGGSKSALTPARHAAGEQYWKLDFHNIKLWALERMSHCTADVIHKTGLIQADVAWFVPHQASTTIIREWADRLGIAMERVVLTYEEMGNISGASIPVALDRAKRAGRFRNGEWIVMPAVGAGMAWGALSYRWAGDDNPVQPGREG